MSRDSVVIVDAVRSPIGRGRLSRGDRPGGSLSSLHPVDLLAQVLVGLVGRTGVDPSIVDDVLIGCVSQASEQAFTPARLAWLAAGMPDHVPGVTIDRRCGSGQQAVEFAAHGILAGAYDVVIAGGVESMSRVPMGSARLGADVFGEGVQTRYAPGLIGQGVAAELVAQRYGITRRDMDDYAVRSHARAKSASSVMAGEIVSVIVPDGDGPRRKVTEDEVIRPETTADSLSRLKPAFADDPAAERYPDLEWGVTAGNSSQISDGAAVLLLMSEQKAEHLGLRPRARILSTAVVGSDPLLMLTGPIPATEKALARAGLALADIDHVEVNEAFASVPLAWQRHFKADGDRVNPSGGAIALGHPLGASGARLLTTMLGALEASGGRYGLQTMCENGGMANALVIERL